jgi:hypothetical protein
MTPKPGNPYGILLPTVEDEAALDKHIRALHQENGMWELSDEKVTKMIRAATRGEDGGKVIIGLIKDGGTEIEGSICLMLSEVYYAPIWHLVEQWNFVGKPYRQSTHAKRLIQFAKWCSDSMSNSLNGAGIEQTEVPLVIGILTQEQLASKIRLYRRQGLQQVGAYFMYRGAPEKSINQDLWECPECTALHDRAHLPKKVLSKIVNERVRREMGSGNGVVRHGQ